MNVLIVEDNYDKVRKIYNVLNAYRSSITTVRSAVEATKAMEKIKYDVVIVDAFIPDIEGGDISPSGGVELLESMSLLPTLHYPKFVMGLTNEVGDFASLKESFKKEGVFIFRENEDFDEWTSLTLKKVRTFEGSLTDFDCDIAIVAALKNPELSEFLRITDYNWEQFTHGGHIFYRGFTHDKNGNTLRILATACQRMGMAAAANITSHIAVAFRPKLMFMTGICAGIKGKVNFGDIVVADHTYDYGAGKIISDDSGEVKFLKDPHHVSLKQNLRTIVNDLTTDIDFTKAIYEGWQGKRGESPPSIYLSPMACGAQVVADAAIIQELQIDNRKVLALEMESYGFMSSCEKHDIAAITAKSVCDFGDSQKNDDFQQYAAYTSAAFFKKYISEYV